MTVARPGLGHELVPGQSGVKARRDGCKCMMSQRTYKRFSCGNILISVTIIELLLINTNI